MYVCARFPFPCWLSAKKDRCVCVWTRFSYYFYLIYDNWRNVMEGLSRPYKVPWLHPNRRRQWLFQCMFVTFKYKSDKLGYTRGFVSYSVSRFLFFSLCFFSSLLLLSFIFVLDRRSFGHPILVSNKHQFLGSPQCAVTSRGNNRRWICAHVHFSLSIISFHKYAVKIFSCEVKFLLVRAFLKPYIISKRLISASLKNVSKHLDKVKTFHFFLFISLEKKKTLNFIYLIFSVL